MRYYKEALALCEEEGLDPFSDEVIGVKIQIAAFLEGIWNHATAAKILEQLLADCKKWVELEGHKHIEDGRRSVVLGKTVGIGAKLGDLYSHANLRQPDAAEAALVGAVETVLREKRRRETEGVKPGEGEWMSNEEIGGALERMHMTCGVVSVADEFYRPRTSIRVERELLPGDTALLASIDTVPTYFMPCSNPYEQSCDRDSPTAAVQTQVWKPEHCLTILE